MVLQKALACFSATWQPDWSIRFLDGISINLLSDNVDWWHNLRDQLRKMVWQETPFTSRLDFHDAHHDLIDYPSTVALCRRGFHFAKAKLSLTKLSPRKFLHLRTLLTGAIYSGERLWKANQVPSPECVFCPAKVESVEHLLWECSAWTQQRALLLSKYPAQFLNSLLGCMRQCGVILSHCFPARTQRTVFASVLQNTFIDILEAREQCRATSLRKPKPSADPLQSAPDPDDIQALNPIAFTRKDVFPTYPWEWESPQHDVVFEKFFQGEVPDNWRRFSGNAEWTYDLDLFPAMVWYYRQLQWPEYVAEHSISWCELAIDCQASAHCFFYSVKQKNS